VYQTNMNRRSLRSVLLLGAASAAAIGLSAPAYAQDQSVETVVVTGSRIAQTGLYSTSPVTAVGQQEIKLEGTTNVETLINNLPSAFADMGEAESNGATGTANVDLRDLGSKRTLVLIDGLREQPGDVTVPVPDLNFIPAALIDHVEVLTGGASAVYGSDAVSGVVNFVMDKDFQGVELNASYSVAQHNNDDSFDRAIEAQGLGGTLPGSVALAPSSVLDGATSDIDLIMGTATANGKGNIEAYVGYRNTQGVLENTRDFSACALAAEYNGGVYPNGSPTPNGLGFQGYYCAGSSTSFPNPKIIPESGPYNGLHFTNTPSGTTLVPYTHQDEFNFAPYNYLQRPDQRYTAGYFGHYEINPQFDVYSNAMFMDDQTPAQIAPSGQFDGTTYNINCSNPFLGSPGTPTSPYNIIGCGAVGPTGTVPILLGYRQLGVGPRIDNLRHIDYRLVEGVKGDLGNGWSYNVSAEYGTSIFQEEYVNDVSISRSQEALDVVLSGGVPVCESGVAGCVPLNVFQTGAESAAASNFIRGDGFQEGDTVEQDIQGAITGDLGAWGGQSPWAKNPIAVAGGFEYRQEYLTDQSDEEFESGDLAGQGGPRESVSGGYNVTEGFGEIHIPLVTDVPYAELFQFNGAYRYSSYNLAGSTSTYSGGLEFQPIDDVRIRASYQRAVRAPNVVELFSPQSIGLWSGQDPCSGTTPVYTLAQCERTGATAAELGTGIGGGSPVGIQPCPASQCSELGGGNPHLKPEVSDSRSIGVVFTPTFFQGFTATVDYFDIEVVGAIGSEPESAILSTCLNTGAQCGDIVRGTDGIIFGTGPGSGYVSGALINTGLLATQGYDFEANYNTNMDDWGIVGKGWGSLAFNFVGTYLEMLKEVAYQGDPDEYNCAGYFGPICGTPAPKWRHKLRVTWTSPWDIDFSAQWRYMSAVWLDVNQANEPTFAGYCGGGCYDFQDAKINAYNYLDLSASWTIRDGLTLNFGVNNVFDKNPPTLDSENIGVTGPPFGNGGTYPQVYDSLGRMLFADVVIKY